MASFGNISVEVNIPLSATDRNGIKYSPEAITRGVAEFNAKGTYIPLTVLLDNNKRATVGKVTSMSTIGDTLTAIATVGLGGTCEDAEVSEGREVAALTFKSVGFVSEAEPREDLEETTPRAVTVEVDSGKKTYTLTGDEFTTLRAALADYKLYVESKLSDAGDQAETDKWTALKGSTESLITLFN